MPSEPRRYLEETQEAGLGSLRGCLVEGDAEQRSRERRVRRRALIISILAQSVVLAALVLVPLFGKTERLVAKEFVPIPPYGRPSHHVARDRSHANSNPIGDHRFTFDPNPGRPHPSAPTTTDTTGVDTTDFDSLSGPQNSGPACSGCIPGDRNAGPRPPQPMAETPIRPRVVRMTTIDPALLIHRVEPVYPHLALQIHKEGRVELHAIIATDGTIQSLQIVAGDPIFYWSAKEAVQQWRYKPTILNGSPVEIDTSITVIYTMQH